MIRQISVFLENRSGRLADVCRILGEHEIDIIAISISDTTDFGILRLIVTQPDKAEQVLRNQQFKVNQSTVLAVGVNDKPGGLGSILQTLAGKNIDIEYMYAVGKDTSGAIIIMKVSEKEVAIEILKEKEIQLYQEKSLFKI